MAGTPYGYVQMRVSNAEIPSLYTRGIGVGTVAKIRSFRVDFSCRCVADCDVVDFNGANLCLDCPVNFLRRFHIKS